MTNSVATRPARATRRAIGGSGALASARRTSLSPTCPAAAKVAGCNAARRTRRRLERIISGDPRLSWLVVRPRHSLGWRRRSAMACRDRRSSMRPDCGRRRGPPVTLQPQARARFEGPGGCGPRWGDDAAPSPGQVDGRGPSPLDCWPAVNLPMAAAPDTKKTQTRGEPRMASPHVPV
jgi:hypothetical protein